MSEFNTARSFSQDLLAGIMFAGIGTFGAVHSAGFSVGTIGRMGPGFFPLAISVCLVLVGLGCVLKALTVGSERVAIPQFRPLVFVVCSVFVFASVVEPWGLVIAVALLTLLARLAETKFKPLQTSMLAIGMITMGIVVFVHGLRLPFRIFPI